MHETFLHHDVLIYDSKDGGFSWIRPAGALESFSVDKDFLGYHATLPHAVGEARKRGRHIKHWADPSVGVPMSCTQIATPFDQA